MLRGVNKVILLGNLGKDPEIRYSASGNTVCNFRIATTDTWKDKQSGQKKERTEWHTIVVFNKLASIVQQYLKKGSRVYIEGRLQTRKWQAQNGQQRYITEIVASEIHIIEFKVVSNIALKAVKAGKAIKAVKASKAIKAVKVVEKFDDENFDDELPF